MKGTGGTIFLKGFGKHVKELRNKRGLTQANLAFEAELSVSQVQRIEYGNHNLTILTLMALAKALEVEPAELINFSY